MNRILLVFINFIVFNFTFSQIKVSVYNIKITNGFNVLADNDEFCPVSIKLNLDLNNLSSTNGNDKIFVIPAKTKGFILTTLQIIKVNLGSNFKTNTKYNYGDCTIQNVDEYNYSLPFSKGKTFNLFQGYNGTFSHLNENAIDFTMPIGTELLASREGVVIKVIENYNQNCPEKKCTEFNNYILIYHDDGTFSKYIHIKLNGSIVKEGDFVKVNDLIGYSGNVGYSSGPHLHFMVYLQKIDSIETLKTKFKINDGNTSKYLVEKEDYTRNY
ncbi:M23 family metallopeptidase [Flavobacterium sp.]|uniref:M23 family metallopeptidase n=1 Tax=Flavobacterium sp. TaxID=239 RepID=UPI00375311EB